MNGLRKIIRDTLRSGTANTAEPEPAAWYVEVKANQEQAYAFRAKVLAALNERGISPAIRAHIEPELMIAALLLGVKE